MTANDETEDRPHVPNEETAKVIRDARAGIGLTTYPDAEAMFKALDVADTEHRLTVLDRTGDTKHTWRPGNATEEAAARATFDALKGKGYVAFRVTGSGGKGEVVRDFDPALGEIILAPPVVGG